MAYRTRINLSENQLGEIWDRWQQGETLNANDAPTKTVNLLTSLSAANSIVAN